MHSVGGCTHVTDVKRSGQEVCMCTVTKNAYVALTAARVYRCLLLGVC